MKITKRQYILGFFAVTLLFTLVRFIFPSVTHNRTTTVSSSSADGKSADYEKVSLSDVERTPAAQPVGMETDAMQTVFSIRMEVCARVASIVFLAMRPPSPTKTTYSLRLRSSGALNQLLTARLRRRVRSCWYM